MTCGHCVSTVETAISALPGVTAVAIDLKVGAISRVVVASNEPLGGSAVAATVDNAGYHFHGQFTESETGPGPAIELTTGGCCCSAPTRKQPTTSAVPARI